ncbi:fimbrial biogenesis outer membrane usher protein [Providencia alcalifaciens]|uniref:fimbria/pilus outer membrane usher protein n=1 Tax=Providencia alcalifaciens TaxID=126385 RepID=UPI001CE0F161|nr:fimbria/pilus outer membrane usher protein [Providencia alcalifaciens]UBX48525.1 fimbrial biogenesis outer membrane usher protein [Providencia alcalifaciens]
MKQRELKNKYINLLSVTGLVTVCALPSFYAWSEEDTTYEFNSGFIIGSQENVDLERFNTTGISPGKYSVDVYTNGSWKGRYDLDFVAKENGQLGTCYTPALLSELGINVEKFAPMAKLDSKECLFLTQWNSDPDVRDTFHSSTLRVDISVPQIYEQKSSRGYVSEQFWETGIPALNLGYMSNYYDSHSDGNNNASAYLGLNAGLSYDGWLLKHIGNLSWQHNDGTNWHSNQTYLQRPIASWKSKATAGQFYTDGDMFDSISLLGAKIATDDTMYPDSMSTFVPEIRGVAQSNALVTVKQNDVVIYQTSVSPGPFNLNDVYPSGYGNDLVVTIKEADGSESSFSVPYTSMAQLLRPGYTRYQFSGGKSDAKGISNRPFIMQGTLQHGLNNTFTLYGGVTAFDDYQAYLLGAGVNTVIGAVALDVTQSRAVFKQRTDMGQSYRFTFNKLFSETDTNLMLAAYRYSTEDYYSLSNALYAIDADKKGRDSSLGREKNGFSYTINQNLPYDLGSFYFTGRISSYWNRSGIEKQYQLNYNNQFGRFSYGISFMRVYSDNAQGSQDDRISLNVNFPLYFGDNRYATISSNTTFNNDKFDVSQAGINGSFDADNNWTYGLNTSVENGGNKNLSITTGYQTPVVSTNANYSQGQGYRQYGVSANGSMLVHAGGVTLSPNTASTVALIEAKGAEGATVMGAQNTKIDSQGYAVAPYVRPYRINNVELDPKGSSEDIVFINTTAQVVPYEGSVVKVTFGTKVEKNEVYNVVRAGNKPLPFGANVVNAGGDYIGIVGQGGTVFITNNESKLATVKWDGGECSFSLTAGNSQESLCQ